jgi:hypothetical protein
VVLALAAEVPVGQRGEEQTGQILRVQSSSSMAEIQWALEHKLVLVLVLEALPTGTLVEMRAQWTVNHHSLELVPDVPLERVLQYLRKGWTDVVRQRVGFEPEPEPEPEPYQDQRYRDNSLP